MKLLRCADSGLLVEFGELPEVLAMHAALTAELPKGVTELVPAARSLLLRLDPEHADIEKIEALVRALPGRRAAERELVSVPVAYDGEDLRAVAQLTGLTEFEVVDAHTSTEWTVSFGGFVPGFGYLSGDRARLDVPRRTVARTRVPAGSVALNGTFSGIYPRDTPGGWQLIGHTDLEVWRTDRDPPALLRPGVRVRFQETV
ncbi:allophanate hydrolase subunit 1 [Amycolatopsis acidicola]|uniref:Allophanate hydrolase subunit 1 n=1 Tax=Amycolatopsis acidicola TaxID=2596893 RepID=A0A5N0VNK1_9PSEU|nr:allophanate hydrolase subunit 1 [Amycolatopsis acidicola]KAA9166884.1 allophanate hydrolase subunit 1 [Amycolatopsis acidicola]